MTVSSFWASRRRVNPCAGWSLHHHFLITAGFALGVIALLITGGGS